ncbi:MAG: class I SAM-dependent methyltransferase [Candidatus Aminicenantes bacterium]|nr:class I SAM-dependent methyltransferase [Candidatus Aminicenantes bacterium]
MDHPDKIRFEHDFTDRQFVKYLLDSILEYKKNNMKILFSENNPITGEVVKTLDETYKLQCEYYIIDNSSSPVSLTGNVVFYNSLIDFEKEREALDVIVCVSADSKKVHAFFYETQGNPKLFKTPFIYKIRGSETYPLLNEQDLWKEFGIADTHVFITSQFDNGLFESIYRYSLTKVRRKCQVRDAYDLFSCLEQCDSVSGDIIEFGTFEGHSGLLIAEYIKRRNLNKRLFLCDTFDKFPGVDCGIDRWWSNLDIKNFDFTHVKAIFEPYEFVKLVKGEFEKTIHHIPSDRFSFAFVDCDSYEATRFAADYVYPKLSTGGCMVFEDYGHHNLVGARRAVDEFIAGKGNKIFSFFSFFSGLKIVVKLA